MIKVFYLFFFFCLIIALAEISKLPGITGLRMNSHRTVSDKGLIALRKMSSLRELSLYYFERFYLLIGSLCSNSYSNGNKAVLNAICSLSQLIDLSIANFQSSNVFRFARGRRWRSDGPSAEDFGLISSLPNLTAIDISMCPAILPRSFFETLSTMKLTVLRVNSVSFFCDNVLQSFSSMDTLLELAIGKTRVTSKGIQTLRGLKNLTSLDATSLRLNGPALEFIIGNFPCLVFPSFCFFVYLFELKFRGSSMFPVPI